MTAHADRPDTTVAIACYDERRWSSILGAVASARAQTVQPAAIVVSVDHNPALAERLREALTNTPGIPDIPDITVVDNVGARGASGNRNRAAAEARTSVIAFLDDDERAEPDWLEHLLEPLADASVAGTGGGCSPAWELSEPTWFPPEFAWAVGAHYEGLPRTTSAVRGVWSGNMAVRTHVFRAVGGFREDFGKIGDVPLPEDTDLCLRVTVAGHGGWRYVPDAVIHHEVPAARSTRTFLVRRCYAEARGKVLMRELAGDLSQQVDGGALGAETRYLTAIVPRGVLREVRTAVGSLAGRDLETARRSADRTVMMVASVGAAAVGAAHGACTLAGRHLPGRHRLRPEDLS